jgi:hypothetical protein
VWSAQRSCDGVVSAGVPKRLGEDVVQLWCELAARAGAAVVKESAAVCMLEDPAAALAIAVSPDEKRVDDGPQVLAGLGELVEAPAAVVGVGQPLEDPVVDEPG